MKHSLLICGALVAAAPVVGQGLSNQGAILSIQSGAQVSVVGDVTVSSGGTIDNAGTLSLTGNWTNATTGGVLTPATGTVRLTGTTAQQIGGATPTTFHSLDVSGATGPVQLATDVSVGTTGGVLTLGATQVQLNSRTITLNNGAASALSQTTGRLVAETTPAAGYGRLVWVIGSNTGTYTVPMGTSTAPLAMTAAITAAGSSSGNLSFTTYPTPANNQPLPAGVSSLQGDANYALDRFWIITPANYTITPTSTLTLGYQDSEWNTSPNTITESRLRLQRWNGSNWEPSQGSVNPTANTLTSDLQNTYGTFASSDLNRPLPVTLVSFTAQAQARNALLSWNTAQELNNKGFEVEVSLDGINFRRLGFVAGHGTTAAAQQYRYTDAGAARRGTLQYYRLSQLDTDGTATYSAVQTVTFALQPASIAAWPNPTPDTYTLLLTAARAQTVQLTMHDAVGRQVSQVSVPLQAGENQLPATFTETQPAGVYILSGMIDGQIVRTRIVRQ
ncbi:T9SS type A sorting domain-containing protein [Hymenobacter perfusus]|uniref:T9SS C-terminal target domain-containing protein n=1 Tax=Hymenobacter perfusus TaxID=1236770 RepID=A0A428KJJ2_9BACT|nr:T9SS type A sorting domain-containing protein [Hymenobacter perfusus]RSK46647.1 T9SS C-terminal target domain-containing protein [Hymenobacter perfusus]